MNPLQFHRTLLEWSRADDPDDLTKIIKKKCKGSIVNNNKIAEKVSKKIIEFIEDNKAHLRLFDLPALEDLQGLINTFTIWTKETLEQEQRVLLENSIAVAIKLTKDNSVPSRMDETFFSMEEYIHLSLKKNSPFDNLLTTSIANAKETEIRDFVNNLTQTLRLNPSLAIELMHIFFIHASDQAQGCFLSYLHEPFFTQVIYALPQDLIRLNLCNSRKSCTLEDHHILNIASRLNNLECLNLCAQKKLTDAAFIALAENINIANSLRCIDFSWCKLTDAALFKFNMPNLISANFSACIELSDIGVQRLVSSEMMPKLQILNFFLNNLNDAAFLGFCMPNLKEVNFGEGTRLTEVAVHRLIDGTNMSILEKVDFSDCDEINLAELKKIGALVKKRTKLVDLKNRDFDEKINVS